MAIFSKHDRRKPSGSVIKGATIIASGTKIKGDLKLTSSLHIDGEVEGIILSDNIITIGSKGRVNGELVAKNLVVNGFFKGSVESDTIEILSKGNVKGKLTYRELTIEKGAAFAGETIVRSSVEGGNISELNTHKKPETPLKNTAGKV